MTQRTGGTRAKTRQKFRKKPRNRGKVSTNKLLESFKVGEKVNIIQEPAIQRAMPHQRFRGMVGTVTGKQGSVYTVKISDRGKEKLLLSAAVHLRHFSKTP